MDTIVDEEEVVWVPFLLDGRQLLVLWPICILILTAVIERQVDVARPWFVRLELRRVRANKFFEGFDIFLRIAFKGYDWQLRIPFEWAKIEAARVCMFLEKAVQSSRSAIDVSILV